MKKKIVISLLIICIVFIQFYVYADEINSSEKNDVTFKYVQEDQKIMDNIPSTGCKNVYIAEPNTGKIIYEKNAHDKVFPASTTKILTALIALEKCKMDDTATVSQRAIDLVPADYSNAELKVGEKHTIETLLYALMLPSANEAANVLAEHISGSIEEFAELCNTRAKELGCEKLHFVNANGMHDENHYCSAYDLYLIAKECRKYDKFNEIVKAKSFTVPATNIYTRNDRTFKNRNEMLLDGKYYYEKCTGIKTGHTNPAGECFVGSSSYNGLDLICVVLGGKEINSLGLNDRFYDTKNLFEFTYDNYSIKNVAEKGDKVATINVGKATKDTSNLDIVVGNDIATIVPNDIDKENVQLSISINEDIVAPIEENQVLGQITINADGLVYTTDIIASHSVEKLPYLKYNIIAVVALSLIFIIFINLLKKSKKYKFRVLIIEIIIIGIACYIIYPHIKSDMENSNSKLIPENNITIENQDSLEYIVEKTNE